MALNDLLKDYQNHRNNFFGNGNFIKPNSKKQYTELGAKIQVNSLAFKMPKIELKNQEAQKSLFEVLEKNNFLELIQYLEENLFRYGKYAIGVFKFNGEIVLKLGKVLRQEFINNKLYYLLVQIDEIERNTTRYNICLEYDLTKYPNSFNKAYAEEVVSKKQVSLNSVNYFINSNSINVDYIPWVIFKNNYKSISDIEIVDPSLFQILDNCLEMLMLDNFYSSPFLYITSAINSEAAKKTEEAIYKLDKRVVNVNGYEMAFSENGTPLTMLQGSTLSASILQKIDKLNYLIKDALFFRMNSADFGTKNMHNAEVESLNSNYGDYLETKANLREIYYKKFLLMILNILNYEVSEEELKIIVASSTEYLKSQEAIYNTNNDGVALNPNLQLQTATIKKEESFNNEEEE
ncbi:hypothetical protein [[Mycoplasma] anseris]|uniref:Phage portal protein n=1 Tax=[Mycoplasma] anseris TaxID=92400 RepID=A0A2Z4NDR4_9BACT|nr:hypothetical protein [[Mycoplasma] anseris]AWX69700.1 hypothetical protein DP065_03015 [[Mycoplasma] anseris]